ncbi:hypothetical protein JCM10914A_05930 [Paenibacillus sp. JCM 10914]|uniref:hypothetical protein n=1 Tax=Paenibacillus sp. JCM 10914 TaxID=1236974 RepID=UPI0003CC592E|nr:hypothetical protein [Paenibacillus sp. JCM 10914]GAE06974.1 hypothetical protein JCM10914_3171 [Paenibacillus sp. JCM 10914]
MFKQSKSIVQFADDLNINLGTLRNWVGKYREFEHEPVNQMEMVRQQTEVIDDQKREIDDLKKEIAILKKAMHIFSKEFASLVLSNIPFSIMLNQKAYNLVSTMLEHRKNAHTLIMSVRLKL